MAEGIVGSRGENYVTFPLRGGEEDSLRKLREELQHNYERGVRHAPVEVVMRLVMVLEASNVDPVVADSRTIEAFTMRGVETAYPYSQLDRYREISLRVMSGIERYFAWRRWPGEVYRARYGDDPDANFTALFEQLDRASKEKS